MFSLLLCTVFAAAAGTSEPLDPAKVPDADKPKAVKELLEKMKQTLKKLNDASKESRAQKDAVRLGCVGEKLRQAKGLMAVAEASAAALKDALARKDKEVSAHEFNKLTMAGQKVSQLKSESGTCVGELAVYTGDTVVVIENESKDTTDPTQQAYVVPTVPRPVQVSPYQ